MSKVLVNFIQDRSGSMQSVWDETLNGFRSFVKELKEKGKVDGVEYLFSLTTFDTVVETPYQSVPIADVDEGLLAKHGPRGSTALYDAVGATIQNTDAKRNGAEKVIVVVVTDGQENSSREWSKEKLHAAIDEKLKAGDWTFTYLGTQPETWDDASALGVSAGNTSNYTGTKAAAAYQATACAVHSLSHSSLKSARNLLTADYIPDDVAEVAGMTNKKPVPTPPPQPSSRPRSSPKGRWR